MKKNTSFPISILKNIIFERAVISWLAMAISIASYYFTVLEDAKITINPGQSFQVWHNNQQQLQIDYPLNLSNTGAKTGAIVSLALIIESSELEQAILCKWSGTKIYSRGWRFQSKERPISILPKSTADEMISYNCGIDSFQWVPNSGQYIFNFLAWSPGSKSHSAITSIPITIDQSSQKNIAVDLLAMQSNGTWIEGNNFSGQSRKLSEQELNQLLIKH